MAQRASSLAENLPKWRTMPSCPARPRCPAPLPMAAHWRRAADAASHAPVEPACHLTADSHRSVALWTAEMRPRCHFCSFLWQAGLGTLQSFGCQCSRGPGAYFLWVPGTFMWHGSGLRQCQDSAFGTLSLYITAFSLLNHFFLSLPPTCFFYCPVCKIFYLFLRHGLTR